MGFSAKRIIIPFKNNKGDSIDNKTKQAQKKIYDSLNFYQKQIFDTYMLYSVILLDMGRGTGKSYLVASLLLYLSLDKNRSNTYSLSSRFFNVSVKDSVKADMIKIIYALGINELFNMPESYGYIKCIPYNHIILFKGMQHINELKGLSLTCISVDEALLMSYEDYEILEPNLRGADNIHKLILIAYNPQLATDGSLEFCKKFMHDNTLLRINTDILEIQKHNPDKVDKGLLKQYWRDYDTIRKTRPDFFYNKWHGIRYTNINIQPFAHVQFHEIDDIAMSYCLKNGSYAFLDPAFIGGLDTTALSVIWLGEGMVYATGITFFSQWSDDRVINEIITFLERFNCQEFFYESNGVGASVEDVFSQKGVIAVPKHSTSNKVARIYSISAYLENLYFLKNEFSNEYENQIKMFTHDYKKRKMKVDAPDSLANALIHAEFLNF